MIWESWPWKEALKRDLSGVRRRVRAAAKAKESDEALEVAIERLVFNTAYAVRKLSEAQKLTDTYRASSYRVQRFPRGPRSGPVDLLNWHRIEDHYDLDHGASEAMPLARICNLLIHSFVFSVGFADEPWSVAGFFFNSDRTKDHGVWWLEWSEFIRIHQGVVTDNVVKSHGTRAPDGSWKFTNLGPGDL